MTTGTLTLLLGLIAPVWASPLQAAAGASTPPSQSKEIARHVLIVANNRSLQEEIAPLSFADDDGARYFELFLAARATVSLLTVLDPDAQRRYPEAALVSAPPRKQAVLGAAREIFQGIAEDNAQGKETHFYFIFSGHGGVGPNREGYIHLLDEPLRRSELYREIVGRSPATFNHLLLDACNAYYFVHKRGDTSDRQGDYREAVQDFLRSEELASYPNTGVILGASSESETHEWSRFEAGIFSHELRGALLGAADVDGDRRIRYAEAAACIEAANAAIDNPRARLKVYFRPPAMQVEAPLLDTRAFAWYPRLELGEKLAGRYHLEDGRGIRLADLNYSEEQPVAVALIGRFPFFLRTPEGEARIDIDVDSYDPAAPPIFVASDLTFGASSASHRGGIEESFRKHLYQVPFGQGFYQGVVSSVGPFEKGNPAPSAAGLPQTGLPWLGLGGGTLLGLGLATVAVGAYFGTQADASFRAYQTSAPDDAAELMARTKQWSAMANGLFIGAAAFGLAGTTLVTVHYLAE